jgi:thiosulfate reductase/polysulfide reductase chain A
MALFSHGIGGNFLKHTSRPTARPTSPRPPSPSAAGRATSVSASPSARTSGSPERTDIENAQCLVLIGSHLGENMHNTQVQEFATAVGRGATHHRRRPALLRRRQQGEALPADQTGHRPRAAAGLDARARHREALRRATTSRKYGFGFEQFRPPRGRYTPEWAYPETGIEPEVIRATAREMARHRPPTLVHPGRHVNWYGDDAQRSRAIALLNALLGSWGRKGGFYQPARWTAAGLSLPGLPERRSAPRSTTRTKNTRSRTRRSPPASARPRSPAALPDQGLAGLRDQPPPRAAQPRPRRSAPSSSSTCWWWSTSSRARSPAGPTSSCRSRRTWSATTTSTSSSSRSPSSRCASRWSSLPHDQKPNWWIARELAVKLGLGARFSPGRTSRSTSPTASRKEAGLDFATLKRDGIIAARAEPIYFEEGAPAEFGTPSGKIEFYSTQLAGRPASTPCRSTPRPPPVPPGGLPPALRPRADAHLQPHPHQPLLTRHDAENAVWVNTGRPPPRPEAATACGCATRTASSATPSPSRPPSASGPTASTWCTASATPPAACATPSARAPATPSSSRATRRPAHGRHRR